MGPILALILTLAAWTGSGPVLTLAQVRADAVANPTSYGVVSDATLTALAGGTCSSDRILYCSGTDVVSSAVQTSFGRTLGAAANAAAAQGTLGLSSFVQGLMDDGDAATFRASSGAYGLNDNAIFNNLSSYGGRALATNSITVASTPYTVTATDDVIFCNPDGGAVTINLPPAAAGTRRLMVYNTGVGANACVLDPNAGEVINTAATLSLSLAAPDAEIVSSGSAWFAWQ